MTNTVPTNNKAIAITFDDGPNPIYTPQVLEIFANAGGKATFFMIGEKMEKYPEIVRMAKEKGHQIGNHTYTHADLSKLSVEELKEEIKRTEELIQELTGEMPHVLRPPFLLFNEETVAIAEENGYPMIGALNLDARDWEQPGVNHILEESRKHVKEGSILIFHDGYGDRSQTIEAISKLVPELTEKGFQLVTVSELLTLSNSNKQ
ncbi:polysaccharide deacetylase family protein [Oceanobacillus halophilus]|uniref:Polysaccharide deacetylase family protein n=1 Tax=Oceanobacillus halophilus TaxID=930130 RepID=A0A494ZZY3_9BACI|nr:polysaccharide deacetylase family protein [Oceanobacillus halophilus]RKQ32543.1 polysaccharide deacetylase family protein [Oceanobacillus halophilus]